MVFSVLRIILFCLYASLYLFNNEAKIHLPENVIVPAVIAFGDSFVDTGNNNYVKTLGKCNFPPYGKDFVDRKPTGRFSNGKTIADYIVEGFGVKEYLPAYLDPSIQDNDLLTGVSFASGGSGYDPLTTKISSAIPLLDQLDLFEQYIKKLETIVGKEIAMKIITNGVFMVVASTNDLIFSLPIRRIHYDVPAYDNMLVNLTLSFLEELYKLGARRIAVFSAPPIGCFPAERTVSGGAHRMCVEKGNEAVQLFNNMLKEKLPFLANNLPQSRVAFVDFYNPVISMINNPQQYGLQITDRGCCGTGLIEVLFLCNELGPLCPDDSKYLFWDSIHLSEIGCNIFVNQTLPGLMNDLF